MSATLKIEHAVVDFETWKRAFERDPIGRERAGVLRYRVFRPADGTSSVIVDLDFAGPDEAQAFLESLRQVWSRTELSPGLARGSARPPEARILLQVETHTYPLGATG